MMMSSDPADREPAENQDRLALRRWITAGLQIPEVRDLHGDAGYLLSNMIAKYTLAASKYQLSTAALHWFRANSVDLSKSYARSRFYGKGSALMYEHSIPSSIIRSILLDLEPEDSTVKSVLERAVLWLWCCVQRTTRCAAMGLPGLCLWGGNLAIAPMPAMRMPRLN